MSSFQVRPFSQDCLIELIELATLASSILLQQDQQIGYLFEYLNELNAKTIVFEPSYIDKDFLEDFAHYYVKCFNDYERKCSRIHFFDIDITEAEFDTLISEPSNPRVTDLQNSYLGFSVIKNLPQTIIGRTCLKVYDDTGDRQFPTLQNYSAHLYGIPLKVKSLAFQEQDQVASACATSCLWSIFHASGKLFQHPIPSPVEITKAASELMPAQSRVFPNHSLDFNQMAQGIRYVGLEPYHISVLNNDYLLKSTVYAYLRSGIPVALVIYLVDTSFGKNVNHEVQHAITVTGFCIDSATVPSPVGASGFLTKASTIEKLYCHDDQVGPFARMVSDGKTVLNGTVTYPSLSTSWRGKDGIIGSIRAVPNVIIAPLYHKIRIPLAFVEERIIAFDALVDVFMQLGKITKSDRLVWDVFLQQQKEFKNEIRNDSALANDKRKEILLADMPRFIWRAKCYSNQQPVIEVNFDATDIAQGGCVNNVIVFNDRFAEEIRAIMNDPIDKDQVQTTKAADIFETMT